MCNIHRQYFLCAHCYCIISLLEKRDSEHSTKKIIVNILISLISEMVKFDGVFICWFVFWGVLFWFWVFFNHEIKLVRNIHVKSLLNKKKQITCIVCTLSSSYCGNDMKSHPLSQIPIKCWNTNSKSIIYLSLNTFTTEAGFYQI